MSTNLIKPLRLPLMPAIAVRERLSGPGRAREYGDEETIMEDAESVRQYDAIGKTIEVGPHLFCARSISRLIPEGGSVLDLGCGSARLLARLANGRPDIRITGLDLSDPMLETGRRNLAEEGLDDRVELRRADITDFGLDPGQRVDVVTCNYALHHMPTEEIAVACLEQIARVRSETGCAVWIFDFARLRNSATFPAFAAAFNWPGPVVLADGIASEKSAFTFEEMRSMLERAGLGDLEGVRSRPLGEAQAHWAHSRANPEPVTGLWQSSDLPAGTAPVAAMIRSSFPRSLTRT